MKKFFKWFAIVVVALIVLAMVGFQVMKHNTKKHSPEETVTYTENGYDLEVEYCRPYKKERVVFGELVPYGEVWRTGANEATTFETETDLMIDGTVLPKGEYTLWTIPGRKEWEVIFNKGEYGWGVNWEEQASRQPELDVLSVRVPVQKNFKVQEQFTIEIEKNPPLLMIGWDDIRVDVPISKP